MPGFHGDLVLDWVWKDLKTHQCVCITLVYYGSQDTCHIIVEHHIYCIELSNTAKTLEQIHLVSLTPNPSNAEGSAFQKASRQSF